MLEKVTRPDLCVGCPRRNKCQELAGKAALGDTYIAVDCIGQGPYVDKTDEVLLKLSWVETPLVCGKNLQNDPDQIETGNPVRDILANKLRNPRLQSDS